MHRFCRSALPSFFAVIAFFLAWVGSLGCEFVQFTLPPTNSNNATVDDEPITVHFGIWYRQSVEFYNYTDSTGGGGGYYKVSTCEGYDESIAIDPSWMAARAFSVLVLVLGGLALLLALAKCCCANHVLVNIGRLNGSVYLLVTLFQGLTLIALPSKLCQNNDYIRQRMGQDNGAYTFPQECNISEDAKCIISATVFWFLAGVLSCITYRAGRNKIETRSVHEHVSYFAEPLLPDVSYPADQLLPDEYESQLP